MKNVFWASIAALAIFCGVGVASNRFTNFPNGIGVAGVEIRTTPAELNLKEVSIPLSCSAGDTSIVGTYAVPAAMTVSDIKVAFSQYPSSTATVGTSSVKIMVMNWDLSATTLDTVGLATTLDTTKAAGDNGYTKTVTLHSAANLALAAGDVVTSRVISTATTGIATSTCQGGVLTMRFNPY